MVHIQYGNKLYKIYYTYAIFGILLFYVYVLYIYNNCKNYCSIIIIFISCIGNIGSSMCDENVMRYQKSYKNKVIK